MENDRLSHGPVLEQAEESIFTWQELLNSKRFERVDYECLTQDENDVLNLFYSEKKTYGEIARALSGPGRSINAKKVDNLLQSAKCKLKKQFPDTIQTKNSIKIPVSLKENLSTLPFIPISPIKPLSKSKEVKMSWIDRRHGTDYKLYYNARKEGKEYPLGSQVACSLPIRGLQIDILLAMPQFHWNTIRMPEATDSISIVMKESKPTGHYNHASFQVRLSLL